MSASISAALLAGRAETPRALVKARAVVVEKRMVIDMLLSDSCSKSTKQDCDWMMACKVREWLMSQESER